MDYSKLGTVDTEGESDDEYTPDLEEFQLKLDNKKSPSAARMAAQKRKHDKPKPHSRPPSSLENDTIKETTDSSKSPKQRKENLNIKTVALPKCSKLHSFKCPSCEHTSQSEKE